MQSGRRLVSYAKLHSGTPTVSSFDIREERHTTADGVVEDELEADASGMKKKVGRPIAYKGDIHSPHLTDAERRRIKRRVCLHTPKAQP